MAEPPEHEQGEFDEWHDEMADAIADTLPELPDGYTYHVRTRSSVDGERVWVLIGAKSRLIDDLDSFSEEGSVPTGGIDGWWAEFFADEDETDGNDQDSPSHEN